MILALGFSTCETLQMILHIKCLQLLQPFVKYDLLSAQDGTHW